MLSHAEPTMVGGRVEEYINRNNQEINQFEKNEQSEQTYSRDVGNIEAKMPSCDDCGLMFENVSDLARHMNRWCPENNELKRKRDDDEDDYTSSKKPRFEDQIIIDDGEDVALTKLAEQAREANEDKWEAKVNKYIEDGLTEEEARRKADRKLKDEDLDEIMSRYESLIQYILQLKDGRLHLKVMKLVDDLVQEGTDYKKAIKIAIRKYKHLLENYLDEAVDNESYEESDDSSDDEDDDSEVEEEEEEDN